jgi:hypothetical protein
MDTDFTVIEGLVSEFESGAPIDSVLADINSDEDLLWHWGSDHFSDTDEFFFLAHESDVFLVHEVIEDYFDRQHPQKTPILVRESGSALGKSIRCT